MHLLNVKWVLSLRLLCCFEAFPKERVNQEDFAVEFNGIYFSRNILKKEIRGEAKHNIEFMEVRVNKYSEGEIDGQKDISR